MNNEFYKELDEAYLGVKEFLEPYCKSTVLQNLLLNEARAFFYASIINTFFENLNKTNIQKYNLPKGKIGEIKRTFKYLQKDIRSALICTLKPKKINEKFYKNFKSTMKSKYPKFQKIIVEIENEIDLRNAKDYVQIKEKEIKKIDRKSVV